MASIRQINASKANGALSRGPVTEDGKRRSSLNAERHGLLAKYTLIGDEGREGFDELLSDHIDRFQPRDRVEMAMIEKMAIADWKINRLRAIETVMFNNGMSLQTRGSCIERLEGAFSQLAESAKLPLLSRYYTALDRAYQRQMNQLILLRKEFPVVETEIAVEDTELPIDAPEVPTAEFPNEPA